MKEEDLFESYAENKEEPEEETPRKTYTQETGNRTYKSVVLNKNTVDLLVKIDPFRTLSDLISVVVSKTRNVVVDPSMLKSYLESMPPKIYHTSIREDVHRELILVKRSNGFKTLAITLDALAVMYIAQKCRERKFHDICYKTAFYG